jgi:flap endonuclease-1
MGVDLGSLVTPRETAIAALSGRTIAVDAYNALYQFLSVIRQPDGTPLKDAQGRVTSHLAGLLYRFGNLVEAGIDPILVFDGKPPVLKSRTVAERRARKEKAQQEYEEALAEGDLERARSKAAQTSKLTKEMIEQAKRLALALGLGVVQAPSEGEAQATALVQEGRAHAVSSQDYDSLLFGAPRLVRNLAVTGRRRLPRKQVWVDVVPEEIELAAAEEEIGLPRARLVDLALLLGTDFNAGVKGIGPKKALALLAKYHDLDAVRLAVEAGTMEEKAVAKALAEGWDDLGDVAVLRRVFLEPDVEANAPIERAALDGEEVVHILVAEHGFSEGRVRAALERYEKARAGKKQKSLDAFF